jgi:cellulose synthase/poly-beta-1,6-N-acetylglucosamine synthase-like glycosyltransferase
MACRGNEHGLRGDIDAVLNQAYPNYRIIIVTDTDQDPAYAIAKSALVQNPTRDGRLYTADPAQVSSGKIAALLTAIRKDGWESDVYAFIDSDALATRRWLKEMVDPLVDASLGATTGFRWYFPAKGGFWSYVESAWNAVGTNLMFDERYNFPWGGAMAILKTKLKELEIAEVWRDAISDDLSLNAALRRHGYRIQFLPQCTVATYNEATMHSFVKWATRQVALTRAFNRKLWNYGLVAHGFFTLAMALGLVSLIGGVVSSAIWFFPAALLLTPSVLGVFKNNQRIMTLKRAVPEFRSDFERTRWGGSIASLIVPWLMTYCIIKSAGMKEISWRGRTYKLTGQTTLASTRKLPETTFPEEA